MITKPKAMKTPALPSQDVVDGHNLLHLDFQAWCKHCVDGRAQDNPHFKVSVAKDPSGKAVIQVDYMLLRYGKQLKKTVLCAVETEHGEGIATEVHSKGRGTEYAARPLEFFLQEIGAI